MAFGSVWMVSFSFSVEGLAGLFNRLTDPYKAEDGSATTTMTDADLSGLQKYLMALVRRAVDLAVRSYLFSVGYSRTTTFKGNGTVQG